MKFLIIFLMSFCLISTAIAWEHDIYEEDGVLYIIGHPTTEDLDRVDAIRKEQQLKRRIDVQKELERDHEIRMTKLWGEIVKDIYEIEAMRLEAILQKDNVTVKNYNNVRQIIK